jgi:hypothetical protein
VGGYFPGPVGVAVFVGVKFGGYLLAGIALKKLQPAIHASALKIAGARTALGILLGPPMTLLGAFLMGFAVPESSSGVPTYGAYAFLVLARVLVWAFIIFVFTKRSQTAQSAIWTYALAGAAWSCLLDVPGFGLAMISPGKIVVC